MAPWFLSFPGSAMAEDSGLPQQIQSMERSIVFLRQEHLTMLHSLHLEILSLQKRCTELQDEEELLELHCRDMENSLHEQDCSIGELRKELTHKGALVGALRANLKQKERHFLEELKRRSHCSTVLHTELQKQTEAAAYLSFQLHAARQKLHHQRMQQRECVPMEKVLGPAEPTSMPDPALFLNPRWHRARPRHAVAPAPPPVGVVNEQGTERGGEGPAESQKEAVSSAAVPPAAETKAD
uniref:CCDC92/74 N-terminal domain-containing protein n=1 Tax=Periophthalmus magnuspinnatus TaxID=409849 RepID=A0A3B4BCI8_9GOBI